ncbi:hypothetical protein, conserved [Eimeria tenella]|uniref:Uncharacterized protein n=1 Tax=Eimeria tenella TaxID=5802 RepID=U6KJ15_EIMTE|nr:hypothetical protein, conserved [Eimeria tenella]CDJ37899.1 hypothetical protein, conserved [Eimeria tenella]|eukprot:XP_013228737.1 hypothetical protein, conserved [Eimeria tenella]
MRCFAPLLGPRATAALGPGGPQGPLTRLQVTAAEKQQGSVCEMPFLLPPRSFLVSSSCSSSSSRVQQLRLWRRPAIAAAFLNAKGRVLADALILWRDSKDGHPRFLLDVGLPVCGRLLTYLERHAISFNVSFGEEPSLAALQLLPPPRVSLLLQQEGRGWGPCVARRPPKDRPPEALLQEFYDFAICPSAGEQLFHYIEHPSISAAADAAAAAAAADPAAAASAAANPVEGEEAPGRWTEGLFAADPRTWRLGHRVYVHRNLWGPPEEEKAPQEDCAALAASLPLVAGAEEAEEADSPSAAAAAAAQQQQQSREPAAQQHCAGQQQGREYEVYRHLVGVCEGPQEVGVGDALPLSINMDFLGFLSLQNKGCYIGQEVLTRALHQLASRRRLALLLRGPPWPLGAPAKVQAGAAGGPPVGPGALSLETTIPARVFSWWLEALRAAASGVVGAQQTPGGPPKGPQGGPHEGPQEDGERAPLPKGYSVGPGALVLKQVPGAAPGRVSEWKEIGVVLAFEEAVGGGICLLRSRPGEGPLKTPEDMARFAAGLAGASVRVSTKPTPSGGPEGPYDPAEAASVFMVVPAPYVFDLLLQNLHEQKTESSRSS